MTQMSDTRLAFVGYIIEDDTLLPHYATKGASGCDLRASEDSNVPAGASCLIGTGLRLEIPEGLEGQVRPRSGLAAKHGITVLNSPGTIDSDYTGEIKVILYNTSAQDFFIKKGDRIAQLVFSEVIRVAFLKSEKLSDTDRGIGGFGSTGVR